MLTFIRKTLGSSSVSATFLAVLAVEILVILIIGTTLVAYFKMNTGNGIFFAMILSLLLTFAYGFFQILNSQKRKMSQLVEDSLSNRRALDFLVLENLSQPLGSLIREYSEDAALKIIRSAAKDAKTIYNTNICYQYDGPPKNFCLMKEIYETWYNTDTKSEWIDIVTPSQIFDRRYESLNVDRVNLSKKHFLIVTRHSFPMINFTIIEKQDGQQVVFFGWFDNLNEMKIFRSESREILNIFALLFRDLQKIPLWIEKMEVDYSGSSNNRIFSPNLVDRTGVWGTIAFDKDGQIESFGFLVFKHTSPTKEVVENSFSLIIEGRIYDRTLSLIEKINHSPSQVIHHAEKTFIEYQFRSPNSSKVHSGICVYNFTKDKVKDGTLSKLEGFYIPDTSNDKHRIIGIKLFEQIEDHNNLAHQAATTLLQSKKDISEAIKISTISLRKLNFVAEESFKEVEQLVKIQGV